MTPLNLLLDAAATYRLTRLATQDVLTQPTRDRIIRWTYRDRPFTHDMLIALDTGPPGAWQQFTEDDPDPPKLATLITCRWCAGMWIGFLVCTLRIFTPRLWRPTAWALTCASAAAWLARLETD